MDPAKMKVVDLRSELGALGLDTKGNKPALVERLKKALESKTGKAIADTTILDTSTEDAEDTPKRPGPAARTRRRSSSLRLAATPAKQPRREITPEPIAEVKDEDRYSPGASSPEPEKEKSPSPEPVPEPAPVEKSPSPEPEPVREPTPEPAIREPTPEPPAPEPPVPEESEKSSEEETLDVPIKVEESVPEAMDTSEPSEVLAKGESAESAEDKETKEAGQDATSDKKRDRKSRFEDRERELTEEEEWDLFNKRLVEREKERVEREKKQAEDDAKKLEELADDPIKLKRLQRKHEKKARWNNYYRNIEVTNEILTPPTEEDYAAKGKHSGKGKKDSAQDAAQKYVEPELNDDKISLSWYDSDLNQYMNLPELNEVTPLNDGAFAHAWAGVRATHGVEGGRVCYEVKVGALVPSTESVEKDPVTSALRVGWSTADHTLHLGDGELSWAYESSGRAVNNGEFKEYGKEFTEKDVIGAYVDLESNPCKISYTLNGVELGAAFEFEKSALEGKPLFPHVLTKNICYRVNLGFDRYNMLTKTKIVRNRLEIPVEQVLAEKQKREEELQRAKDEAQRKERERRDKEKREREERQRKKREEREKQDLERKEKEAAERRDRGDTVEEDAKENGDKPSEPEIKQEPADVDMGEAVPPAPAEPAAPAPAPEEPAPAEPAPAEPAPAVPADAEVKDEPSEPAEMTEEDVLKGHVLDQRIKFVIRYTADEELDGAEACLLPGYVLAAHAALAPGPRRPHALADCEVILMVGMPGAGKTYWVKQYSAEKPEKRYNILSTGALFERMKVDCKPLKSSYEGRWDAMVSKCAKCVLKLVELAHGRRRNFILDQTNVYPSAQRRKLREFEGYRRVCVPVLTDEDTYRERCQQRESADGKEVPDPAILDMKANFTLPEKCSWVDEVIYPELNEEEAKKVVEAFHKEAKAAGVMREREKRERSAGRDAPAAKRQRSQDKRYGGRDDRGRSRDNRDSRDSGWGGGNRWGNNNRGGGGGPPHNRWGGSGGGGGGRDHRNGAPNSRFQGNDRWGNNQRYNDGGDYNRSRDFRGGQQGGRGPMPPPSPHQRPPPPAPFRDRTSRPPPHADRDKRPQGPPPGGAGSWQRGGQIQSNRGGGGGGRNQKDGQNQGQQQPAWNQWGGGWGGWGWNQNQQQAPGWNNWQNWQNWNQQGGQHPQGQASGAGAANAATGTGANAAGATSNAAGNKAAAQQWPANYTAQQWYQWQQWQQQQQNWAGYQQQQQQPQGGGAQAANAQEAQAAWAQYYQQQQSYGNAAASGAAAADKKS